MKTVREQVLAEAKRLFADGSVEAVLALRARDNGLVPHLFQSADDLGRFTPGPKWPLAKTLWLVSRELPPDARLGLICRTCDSRAVREQARLGQYPRQSVICIVMPCDDAQAQACSCAQPRPDVQADAPLRALSPDLRGLLERPDRSALWREHFQRCLKCFGCRNACPVCICPECRLEDDDFVPAGVLPPTPLPWHLCRATHVADSCVNCGACQDACPSGIPLKALHASLAEHLHRTASYRAGCGKTSPLQTPSGAEGPCGAPEPEWKDSLGGGSRPSVKPGGAPGSEGAP